MLRIGLVTVMTLAVTTTVSGKSLAEAMEERENEPLQSTKDFRVGKTYKDDEHSDKYRFIVYTVAKMKAL